MAAANGVPSHALHDAAADVDAMLGLCRLVRAGAPDLWSTFLRFSAKAAVVDFVRDEDAFAYFDYFGRPQVMHFLTRVGINPNDGNSHYCLDLASDIDALRKLDDGELSQRLTQEPRPIRRLRVAPALSLVGHRTRSVRGSHRRRTGAASVFGSCRPRIHGGLDQRGRVDRADPPAL
jgi:exonuclease I